MDERVDGYGFIGTFLRVANFISKILLCILGAERVW